MTPEENQAQLDRAIGLCKTILSDVQIGKNLPRHKADVEKAIAVLDDMIAESEKKGEDTDHYKNLKNELYYIVYEILEKQ